jgi:hypothetical protein
MASWSQQQQQVKRDLDDWGASEGVHMKMSSGVWSYVAVREYQVVVMLEMKNELIDVGQLYQECLYPHLQELLS